MFHGKSKKASQLLILRAVWTKLERLYPKISKSPAQNYLPGLI